MSTFLLPVMDTINESWYKVKGSKGPIWGAILLVLIITIALGILDGILSVYSKNIAAIVNIFIQCFNTLFNLGIVYIGIRRAQDQPISYNMVFRPFEGWLWLKLLIVYLIQFLIFIIPMIVFFVGIFLIMLGSTVAYVSGILVCIAAVLSVIYLAVRLMLALSFVLDKEVNPSDAIALSFQATRSNFWRLIGIMCLQGIIVIISALPLFIGLIWTIPLVTIIFGLIYTKLAVNTSSPSLSQTPQIPV